MAVPGRLFNSAYIAYLFCQDPAIFHTCLLASAVCHFGPFCTFVIIKKWFGEWHTYSLWADQSTKSTRQIFDGNRVKIVLHRIKSVRDLHLSIFRVTKIVDT